MPFMPYFYVACKKVRFRSSAGLCVVANGCASQCHLLLLNFRHSVVQRDFMMPFVIKFSLF